MSYRKISTWQALDWWTVIIYLIMVIAGWFSIYGASYDFDQTSMFDLSGRAGMQMIWILTSLLLAFVILLIDSEWYDIFAYWIYGLVILLLIATVFIAPDIKGSRSWLVLGPVRLQPAEFAKFATSLALAKVFTGYKFQLLTVKNFLLALFIILLPVGLIMMQKETGSALVYLALFMVLYREGMPGAIILVGFSMVLYFVLGIKFGDQEWFGANLGELIVSGLIILITLILIYIYRRTWKDLYHVFIVVGLIAVVAAVSTFFAVDFSYVLIGGGIILAFYLMWLSRKYLYRSYLYIALFTLYSLVFMYSVDYVFDNVMEKHQQVRIKVSLGILDDPAGAGYNVNQSKIAIGSGGLTGKGFLNGTQTKLKYVPEQDTDFIFCTVGEEQGFIGSTLVLLLFLILILRVVHLAERQKETFSRVYGYCVAAILFFHVAINIGMVTGLTPVIGIPLPFFSYGGSSLWGFTILLFILLRLDASRVYKL